MVSKPQIMFKGKRQPIKKRSRQVVCEHFEEAGNTAIGR